MHSFLLLIRAINLPLSKGTTALTNLGIIYHWKIFAVGEYKQYNRKDGGEIVRNWLCRSQHGCRVKYAPEQEKHGQINKPLAADGEVQVNM